VGDLLRDFDLMDHARVAAIQWMERDSGQAPLVGYLSEHWATRFGLVGVG
jgi:hypothetical protein